jgi:hypothetical protein
MRLASAEFPVGEVTVVRHQRAISGVIYPKQWHKGNVKGGDILRSFARMVSSSGDEVD